MKKYMIVEVSYEYDDERYNRNEDDGGKPIVIYSNPSKATEEAARLNREYVMGLGSGWHGIGGHLQYGALHGFTDQLEYELQKRDLITTLFDPNGKEYIFSEDEYDFDIPDWLSDDQLDAVLAALELDFFHVYPVDEVE